MAVASQSVMKRRGAVAIADVNNLALGGRA